MDEPAAFGNNNYGSSRRLRTELSSEYSISNSRGISQVGGAGELFMRDDDIYSMAWQFLLSGNENEPLFGH